VSVVDASVWVAVLMAGDANHDAASRWLRAHVESGEATLLPTLALTEVSGAVACRTGDSSAGARATDLLRSAPGAAFVSLMNREPRPLLV